MYTHICSKYVCESQSTIHNNFIQASTLDTSSSKIVYNDTFYYWSCFLIIIKIVISLRNDIFLCVSVRLVLDGVKTIQCCFVSTATYFYVYHKH